MNTLYHKSILAFKRKRTVGRPRNIGPTLTKSPPRLRVELAYIFTGEEETEVEVMDLRKATFQQLQAEHQSPKDAIAEEAFSFLLPFRLHWDVLGEGDPAIPQGPMGKLSYSKFVHMDSFTHLKQCVSENH